MASISIRNLDDDVKTHLLVATQNGRSMKEEAWLILGDAIECKPSFENSLSKTYGFALMLRLLPHDPFEFFSFGRRNSDTSFTPVGIGR